MGERPQHTAWLDASDVATDTHTNRSPSGWLRPTAQARVAPRAFAFLGFKQIAGSSGGSPLFGLKAGSGPGSRDAVAGIWECRTLFGNLGGAVSGCGRGRDSRRHRTGACGGWRWGARDALRDPLLDVHAQEQPPPANSEGWRHGLARRDSIACALFRDVEQLADISDRHRVHGCTCLAAC